MKRASYFLLLLGLLLVVPQVRADPVGTSHEAEGGVDVVSLDLCTDWMLIRRGGAGRRVVYSPLLYRYPAPWTPTGLPTHDGRLETLLRLDPAQILVGQYNARMLRQRLQQLGKKVTVLPLPQSLSQLADYMGQFETALGLSSGAASSGIRPPPEISESPQAPRLLLLGANGIGTGGDTLEDEIIHRAGWRNWVEDTGWVRVDLERVIMDPPDAILWSKPDSPALANRFAQMPPIRQRLEQQPRFPGGDHDWRWQCPGPWTWTLIDDLARWREAFDES